MGRSSACGGCARNRFRLPCSPLISIESLYCTSHDGSNCVLIELNLVSFEFRRGSDQPLLKALQTYTLSGTRIVGSTQGRWHGVASQRQS